MTVIAMSAHMSPGAHAVSPASVGAGGRPGAHRFTAVCGKPVDVHLLGSCLEAAAMRTPKVTGRSVSYR